MIEPVLQSIGLNEKEIRIFLAILERGEQPASVIAKLVQMPRNTARFILDRLVEKGLVKRFFRANTQRYAAEEPKNLVNILEKRRVDETAIIDQKVMALKEVMAELETRFSPQGSKPKVTFYEGNEGLIRVYEDTLTSSETVRSFVSFDMIVGEFNDYFKSYLERRMKNRIPIRCILPDTPVGIMEARKDRAEMRESRLIPHKTYSFTPEIQIYDGKLSITSWKEKLGILIESPEIYQAMVVAFELAWKEAGRLGKRA